MSLRARRPTPGLGDMARSLAGAAAAFLAFEICLAPVARTVDYSDDVTTPFVRAEADRPRRELAQYREGISLARFHPDGARMTGSAPVAGAPVGLVLGDSNVKAVPVDDAEIMASVVERLAREAGAPVEVRQYGYSGASAPLYAGIAPALLARWDPAWVAVVLDPNDLTPGAAREGAGWRLSVEEGGSAGAVDVSPPPPEGALRRVRQTLVRSSLVRQSVIRYFAISRGPGVDEAEVDTDQAPEVTSAESDAAVRLTVRALREAYGDRLLVVYTPFVGDADGEAPDAVEARLLGACREAGVECVSARSAMLEARDAEGRLSRGFHNTAPGVGHLNATGHAAVAREIWRAASARGAGGG